MSDSTPHTDDSTLLQTESPEWQRIEDLQHLLNKALRQHDAGKQVDASKILATLARQLAQPSPAEQGAKQVAISGVELVDGYWEHVTKRKKSASTGLGRLNDMLGGGLEPGRLMVLLGAPGGGKTTLANQIAVHTANSGRPVMYVTSEDVPYSLLAKTIARQGKVNYTAALKGSEAERSRIEAALKEYRASPAATRLHYLDATMMVDLSVIQASARAHFEQYKDAGQGILIVDYLQRLARGQASYRAGNADLRQAVTVLTEQLRAIAVDLDCCVLALASMNRASGYASAGSALSSAKESGDIEYTADVVMAIAEDQQRVPGSSWLEARTLKIDKNRQGATGFINLNWYAACQEFTELADDDNSQVVEPASNGRKQRGR